jgi:glycosyltransferase involved in cell wall biosynthesis
MTAAQSILLCSKAELHWGIHGALRRNLPGGVAFRTRAPRHVFVGPRHFTIEEAFAKPYFGEFLDPGPGVEPVYSVSWPVLNRRSWVCEIDSFGYSIVFGRHLLAPEARKPGYPFDDPGALAITRQRVGLALSAFAHPSCKALLLFTEAERSNISKWLVHLDLTAHAGAFLEKCRVVRPACPSIPAASLARKFSGRSKLRVVFCGVEFETKNGVVALETFRRILDAEAAVEVTYIGEIPAHFAERYRPTLAKVVHHPLIPRSSVLRIFRDAHILFHPSLSESYGMALVEAAAAGMAIVAARRRRIALSWEFLDAQSGLLLDAGHEGSIDEAKWFADAIVRLADNRAAVEVMGRWNWDRCTTGEFSLHRRNAILCDIFGACPEGETLTLSNLAGRESVDLLTASSAQVRKMSRIYRERVGLAGRNIVM